MSMNRRSFVSRLAAASVVAPFVASAIPMATSTTVSTDEAAILPSSGILAPAEPKWDRFTLLHSRGLLAPCPNCGETRWSAHAFEPNGRTPYTVMCVGCGWIDKNTFERPCQCPDCAGGFGVHVPKESIALEERRVLERDAPVGVYYVSIGDRPVTRTLLNLRDIYEDRYLHHVQQRQIARVSCAVLLLRRNDVAVGVDEQFRQPNGNRVVIGWDTVDCYEWRQEGRRG